jgi:peptidoglycan/xylan/chitin deacetylase (PgdA/CDA1 family)
MLIVVPLMCIGAVVFVSPPTALAGPELITNGSVETVGATASVPLGWNTGGWGTNTRALTYPATGGRTGARFTRIVMSGYVSGDAKWWFSPVSVTPSTSYTFRNWYRSTTTTLFVAEVRATTGATSWIWLKNLAPAAAWTQATATFTTPATAATITVYHLIQSNGTLDTDDSSFSSDAPTPTTTAPVATTTTLPPATTTTTPPVTTTTLAATTTTLPPVSGGLVANPSVETVNPSNASLPQSWAQGGWGTNTRSYSYPTGGAHTGNRFTRVTITARTTGDAKWWFPHAPVQPNTSYTFRDWYRSNVTTQLVAEIRSTTGTVTYTTPVNLPPSTAWAQATWTFTTPANASTLTVFHVIAAVGSLDTDDTSLQLNSTSPTTTVPGATTTTAPAPTTTTTPPTGRPVVYLTFDDGPGPEYTPALMDVLARYGARATFFILGSNARAYPTLTAQMVQRGHVIGNHTDNHPDLTTLTATQITDQLNAAEESIAAATGVRPNCMRPPYGRLNTTASNTIASLGLSTILWTHDTRDWDTSVTSVQAIVNMLNTVSDGSIVLMHDWAPNTLVAVDQWLAANASRFEFRTIPSC